MSWRGLMKYQEIIPHTNGIYEDMMDTMESLIPIKERHDRTTTFTLWVVDCMEEGLITYVEKMELYNYLIHSYGGF